jgi:hypothetical protein
MAEDDYSCEICCENYNQINESKQPKSVPCCNHSFCLSCLLDIYNRNNKTFKCPYCRKTIFQNPREFKTNSKIFQRLLICCNCEYKVLQEELFLCLDNGKMQIKCLKCHDNNDYKLIEYLPALINELKNFDEYYQVNKDSDLISFLQEKIKKQIESFFTDIIQKMTELISHKIISQLKIETNYDLEIEKNELNKKLKQASLDYKYLNEFYSNNSNNMSSKNFSAKKILDIMEFYDNNIDNLQKEIKKISDFKSFIENKHLIELKDDISKDNLSDFLFSNFETILSELPKRQY